MGFCTYCENESVDEEFCDICGKKITEDNFTTESFNDYTETTIECVVKKSTMKKNDRLTWESDLIKTPLEVVPYETSNDEYNLLYFLKDESVSLKSYIEQNYLNQDDLVIVIVRVYRIIKEINNQNLLLGSFDISDLWLKGDNLNTLYLKQSRKFLSTPQDLKDYEFGEIEGLGLISIGEDKLDFRSDITLLGRLYIALATDMKFPTEDYFHERYIAYNLTLFSNIADCDLHTWIGRTVTMNTEEKYQTLEDCIDDFEYLIQSRYINQSENKIGEFEIAAGTHIGIGKDLKMKNTPQEMRNEDSILVKEVLCSDSEEEVHKTLLLVADGISTSSIGTGYEASNIVKDVAEKLWDEKYTYINNITDVQKFVDDVINLSNEKIWEYAYERKGSKAVEQTIMASTLSIAININDRLYYASVGDSPMFLFRGDYVSPLNHEDNRGNEALLNGCDWNRFTKMDNTSSLTNFIGGYNCYKEKEDIIFPIVSEINLTKNEYLLLCSDGLTDYIGTKTSLDSNWATDKKLKEIIYKNSHSSLNEIVNELISTANHHGGGDNISVILMKK